MDDVSTYEIGGQIGADTFAAGDKVDVTAVSKGKGFAGGMKRHGFKGLPASHGAHRVHRHPGSIGACATPSRVLKGTKMAGRMGGGQVTTQNLEIVRADAEAGVVLVRGAVPGPKSGYLTIRRAKRG
jgi:large subunit ribosomal protein L3